MWPVIKRIQLQTVLSNCRTLYLTQHVFSGQVQKPATHIKDFVDTPKPPRQRVKKFKNPFPQSFFVGKCDPEVLEYPEVLNLEEIEKINQLQQQIQAIADEIDSAAIDSSGTVPKTYLNTLSQLQLVGARSPLLNGGLDLTETETLFINEAVAFDGSLAELLNEQQMVSAALLERYGTDEQKERYLKPLIFGEKIIASAFLERMSMFATGECHHAVAVLGSDGGFEISGPIKWVYNAMNADAFIVFAMTCKQDETGERSQSLTAFIVPADAPGLVISPPKPKYALKGVPISQIEFNNVHVSANSILGTINEAFDIMMYGMNGKLNKSNVTIGLGKRILKDVTQYVTHSTVLGMPMIEIDSIKTRLGKIATALYGLESAAFLQAGISDLYINPETFMELSILKVLSSETLRFILDEALQIIGPDSQIKAEFQYLGRLLRDAAFYATCHESDNIMKTTITLKGLQHAGMAMKEEIRKVRNPLMFPTFIVKRIIEGKSRFGGDTGLDLGLKGYLHPSLTEEAKTLEYCISRIFMGTEILLSNYGKEVLEKHMELEALADMTIATYTLAAVLGRSSRSYCIGLSESTWEMDIAYVTATATRTKIDQLLPLVTESRPTNIVNRYNTISDRVLANRGCFTESPIARNF